MRKQGSTMTSGKQDGLYILLVSIHGLIRGTDLELGRDSDTGGQTLYVVELARALGKRPDVARVDLMTRLIVDDAVDPIYAEPLEDLGDNVHIVRIEAGPEGYIRKEQLWDHMDSFADNAMTYLRAQQRLPDVVHSHYADAGYVGARLSKLLGLPQAHTPGHSLGRVKRMRLLANGVSHEDIESRYNMTRRVEAEEETLATAELVIASTNNEVEEQYGLYDCYHPAHMAVVPPGTNLERFHAPDGSEKDSTTRADNSLVRAIGERQEYEGDYRGDPYLITEQQYAIFPSREGPLRIQGPRLQLPLQGEAGPVELQGEPVEIEVLPPAYQSSNGLWLPATRLNLEEAWHPPSQLQVGERIQRTLSLRVTGIPAERLPALMAPKVDGFHVEVEEVELTESTSSFGLVSTRRERVSLEPLVTGVLTLPPVDLHWWDAGLDRGRHAALPAHQLNVQLPPLVEGEPTARLPNPAERSQDQPGLGLILLLTLTSLVSALGWLYTWARLRRLRREYRLSERQQEADRRQRKLLQTNDRAERSTFQALAIACRQNSALQARSRLIEWAQNFWPRTPYRWPGSDLRCRPQPDAGLSHSGSGAAPARSH